MTSSSYRKPSKTYVLAHNLAPASAGLRSVGNQLTPTVGIENAVSQFFQAHQIGDSL
ncbi:hypothetical protein [Fimbriiglobus ruber]|uniref:hypothetical protein n=1 Tax=Fimbriiglobus ruber TaxID=1908690 RepID=UPI00137B787A|nr:hypothetical protein [Fimbriiglobus ruber]